MKVIGKDGSVKDFSFEDLEGKKAFWHTASYILAQAVKRLYPSTKCAAGSAIEEGFYYDFEFDTEFGTAQLEEIEKEMRKIVKESLPPSLLRTKQGGSYCINGAKNESYKLEFNKIREAQLDKVPYMIIVGEKEKNSNKISVRRRNEENLGIMEIEKFIQILQEEMMDKDR